VHRLSHLRGRVACIYGSYLFLYRSCLDDHEPFLTTADSAIKWPPNATKPVPGWKGLEYKSAFPSVRPPGVNFYPPDMDNTVHGLLPFKHLSFF